MCIQLPPFICAILPSNCLHDESRTRGPTYVCRRYCKMHSREMQSRIFSDFFSFKDEEIRVVRPDIKLNAEVVYIETNIIISR